MGSGFKVFGAGSVLTASDVNNYLMEQTTPVFSSTTTRDAAITAPEEGMTAYTSDEDILWYYNGTAWAHVLHCGALPSWTPTISQPSALTISTFSTRSYQRVGKMVNAWASFTIGSAGTAGNVIVIGGLPVAAANSADIHGTYWYFNNIGLFQTGDVAGDSTTTFKMIVQGASNYYGNNPSYAATSGDLVRFQVSYPVA